jgi:uncharacterized membrane protein
LFNRIAAAMAVLCALAAPPSAFAQVDRATLTGTVKDAAGAVVPGATVTVTSLATNVADTQQTTATGTYLAVNLIPGRYRVDVELSGFKKSSETVDLEVGQRARVDATLTVGDVKESISVQGTSPVLNSNDASLGAVIP